MSPGKPRGKSRDAAEGRPEMAIGEGGDIEAGPALEITDATSSTCSPNRENADPAEEPSDDADGATVVAPIERLKTVLDVCLATFLAVRGKLTTYITFGLLEAYRTFYYEVPFEHVVDIINAVGIATVQAGLVDVQFAFAKRTSKAAKDLEGLFGIIIDVDITTTDIVREVERAGVPMPTLGFPSPHGFKVGYPTVARMSPEAFDESGKRFTLAFEGGDPASWHPGQMQRLPRCLRATEAGIIPVTYAATLMNPVPFDGSPTSVPFPFRVRRALGSGAVSEAERTRLREYLDELGIPAPEEPGHLLYAACPASPSHDSPCTYVNVNDAREISLHCVGGHDGTGAKHYTETQLADLAHATCTAEPATTRFDPLTHLPVTPGAVEFIHQALRTWSPVLVESVVFTWMMEHARREVLRFEPHVTMEQVLEVYGQRLRGVHGLPPMFVYYERGTATLVFDDPDGRALPVTTRTGPSLKANAVELKSTGLWLVTVTKTKKGEIIVEPGWTADAASLLQKLALGHAHVLAKLGVPIVTTYGLPVAHVVDSWSIHPSTLNIVAVTVHCTFGDVDEIDAVEFFLALYRAGRLPFASENDVRAFTMLIASPLLRHIAPGLLGVYWFVGPPGAGKDFVAEMVRLIWEQFATPYSRVSFDISLAGELEAKRMLEMGAGCVFARAKEAGKRAGMADALIRFAGTDRLAGRGLYKDEVSIANTFTYVADSAEDLPDRREISRRTVQIAVTFMDDAKSKGTVLDEVRVAAKGIIKSLKRLVETRPPEWYLHQADTGSRPVVPVALAQLLGAKLPAVEGEDLTEVWESMLAFVESPDGETHGKEQLATMNARRAGKASLEAQTLPSFSLAFFIDTMVQKPGKAELFSPYNKKSRELVNRILRETEYRVLVGKQGYMPVEIRGQCYALRLEDGRRFMLATEMAFKTAMMAARAASAARSSATPAAPTPLATEPAATAGSAQPVATSPGPKQSKFTAPTKSLLKKKNGK